MLVFCVNLLVYWLFSFLSMALSVFIHINAWIWMILLYLSPLFYCMNCPFSILKLLCMILLLHYHLVYVHGYLSCTRCSRLNFFFRIFFLLLSFFVVPHFVILRLFIPLCVLHSILGHIFWVIVDVLCPILFVYFSLGCFSFLPFVVSDTEYQGMTIRYI